MQTLVFVVSGVGTQLSRGVSKEWFSRDPANGGGVYKFFNQVGKCSYQSYHLKLTAYRVAFPRVNEDGAQRADLKSSREEHGAATRVWQSAAELRPKVGEGDPTWSRITDSLSETLQWLLSLRSLALAPAPLLAPHPSPGRSGPLTRCQILTQPQRDPQSVKQPQPRHEPQRGPSPRQPGPQPFPPARRRDQAGGRCWRSRSSRCFTQAVTVRHLAAPSGAGSWEGRRAGNRESGILGLWRTRSRPLGRLGTRERRPIFGRRSAAGQGLPIPSKGREGTDSGTYSGGTRLRCALGVKWFCFHTSEGHL